MFVLLCLDIPNTVYLALSPIVGLLVLFYFISVTTSTQGPILSHKRQSPPPRFSHALKMHLSSNTNPQSPKTSLKAVPGAFPNNMWLDWYMQIRVLEPGLGVPAALKGVPAEVCSAISLLLSPQKSMQGKGGFVDYPCRSSTGIILNQSEKPTARC